MLLWIVVGWARFVTRIRVHKARWATSLNPIRWMWANRTQSVTSGTPWPRAP